MIRMCMFKSYLSCVNYKLFSQICLFLLQWLRQRTRKLSRLLNKLQTALQYLENDSSKKKTLLKSTKIFKTL